MDQPQADGFSGSRLAALLVVTTTVVAAHNVALARWDLDVAYVAVGLALGVATVAGRIPGGSARAAIPWLVGGLCVAVVIWAVNPNDSRYVDQSGNAVFGDLVMTFFGVAVLEEVLFRHWLLVGWSRLAPRPPARPTASTLGLVASSAAFALWHVASERSRLGPDAALLEMAPGLLATGLAGVGLGWLRLRSRGVIAPILVHASFNTAVALAVRL